MTRRALYMVFLGIILALLCLPLVAQDLPRKAPNVAFYLHPGVRSFNVIAPKTDEYQQTSGPVNDCHLTVAERSTKICGTIWVKDRETHLPVRNVRLNTCPMDDWDFSKIKFWLTNESGFVNLKMPKNVDLHVGADIPVAYGGRKWEQRYQMSATHFVGTLEMSKIQ